MLHHPYMPWILSGVCLGLAFIHPLLSPLIVVGLCAFIYSVSVSPSLRFVLIGSYIAGVLKYAGAIIWFWDTYPLTWLGFSPSYTQLLLIGLVFTINVLFLALSMMACGAAFFYLWKRNNKLLWLFPVLILVSEVLGSLIFSLYTLGPGSGLNIDFSFGYAGYAIAELPGALPLAIMGGVYALSLWGGLLALAAYLFLTERLERGLNASKIAVIILGVSLAGSHVWLYSRIEPALAKDVIAISTSFDSSLLTTDEGRQIKKDSVKEAVRLALGHDPDIILLPEDSRFVSSFETEEEIFGFLSEAASGTKTVLVDSSRSTLNQQEVALRAYVFDLQTRQLHVIDKQKLVPQGEYLPYLFTLGLKVFSGDEELKEKILTDRSYRPGPATNYEDLDDRVPRILFCFESVSPAGVMSLLGQSGHGLILHPVSHGWFNDSDILRRQLDRMLRLQAIWNKVNIIEAGNMAPTLLYEADGTIKNGEVLDSLPYFSLIRFH